MMKQMLTPEVLEGIKRPWREKYDTHLKPPPKHLYHYTSSSALHEILRESILRGGNYAFMNDRSEFAFGKNLLNDAIGDAISAAPPDFVRDWLEHCARLFTVDGTHPYFVSFCQKGDLLSQWRGYGAHFGRVCICFDTRQLKSGGVYAATPRAVVYSERKQRSMLADLVNGYVAGLRPFGDEWDEESSFTARRSFWIFAMIAIVHFKHQSFAEEHEWRSVRFAWRDEVEDTVFLNAGGLMKPYRAMFKGSENEDLLPITQVITGSGVGEAQTLRSAELMLRYFGYDHVKVSRSTVPMSS